VVEGEDRTRRDSGKRSECAVVSPEGLLGDFWTAVLNQVSFPGKSPAPRLPHSFSISLSLSSNLCSPYTIQSGLVPGFSLFSLRPAIFLYVARKRGRQKIKRENTQTPITRSTISSVRRRSVSDVRESRNPRRPSVSRADLSVGV